MAKLNFSIAIKAPVSKVWWALWNDSTYRQWTSAFHEGSYAQTDWKEGSKVHFLIPSGDGMYGKITQRIDDKLMAFQHIGEVKNFEEQAPFDYPELNNDAHEIYHLNEVDGETTVTVELNTPDAFKSYFEETFPKALTLVKKLSEINDTKTITIVTQISASIENVWNCWTSPEHIVQWNHASDDWHTTRAENDLRVGGTFVSRMEAKDGSFGFDFTGTYDKIKTHELIGYRINDGRNVLVTFTAMENKVNVAETFETEDAHPVEMQREGWQAILNNFKKHVESNS